MKKRILALCLIMCMTLGVVGTIANAFEACPECGGDITDCNGCEGVCRHNYEYTGSSSGPRLTGSHSQEYNGNINTCYYTYENVTETYKCSKCGDTYNNTFRIEYDHTVCQP